MDFKQDDDGDLVIETNSLVMISGSEEVRQRVLQRLRTFLGEWFLNFDIGVPYFQDIFQKDPDPEAIAAVLQNEILGTLGVLSLNDFKLDYKQDRSLSVTFKLKAYNGDLLTFTEGLIA